MEPMPPGVEVLSLKQLDCQGIPPHLILFKQTVEWLPSLAWYFILFLVLELEEWSNHTLFIFSDKWLIDQLYDVVIF